MMSLGNMGLDKIFNPESHAEEEKAYKEAQEKLLAVGARLGRLQEQDGWNDLVSLLETEITRLRTELETCDTDNLKKIQGALSGLQSFWDAVEGAIVEGKQAKLNIEHQAEKY